MTEKTISAEVAPRRFGVTSKKAIKITFVSNVSHASEELRLSFYEFSKSLSTNWINLWTMHKWSFAERPFAFTATCNNQLHY